MRNFYNTSVKARRSFSAFRVIERRTSAKPIFNCSSDNFTDRPVLLFSGFSEPFHLRFGKQYLYLLHVSIINMDNNRGQALFTSDICRYHPWFSRFCFLPVYEYLSNMKYLLPAILLMFFGSAAAVLCQEKVAGEYNDDLNYAQVRKVRVVKTAAETYTFYVTVRHNDQGWDHYADLWQVVDTETGEVLGERVLAHPHDNEQPFTRSRRGIVIPEGTESVTVRARCNKHGYEGKQVVVVLSEPDGGDYTIEE